MPSIRAPEDAPDVVTAIKHLFRNHLYTDFSFIPRDGSDGKPVHRLIVAIHSPKLAERLYGDSPIDELRVQYDDNLALQNLISFLYDDDLVLENISDITKTKAIADRYEVCKLGEICKDELNNLPVCTSDVLSILETAIEYQNVNKENDCIRLISENQEAIFTSRQFLGWPFRRVLDIFLKIKEMNMITEASLLRMAIMWLDKNGTTDNKELLMKKVRMTDISVFEYLDIIIEFPAFFSGVEISYTANEIKSRCVDEKLWKIPETKIPKKEYRDAETNTEKSKCVETPAKAKHDKEINKEELVANMDFFRKELDEAIEKNQDLANKYDVLTIECESKNLEIDRQSKQIKDMKQTIQTLRESNETRKSSLSHASSDSKHKQLTIQILNEEDGVNVFEFSKRARITVQDGSHIRSIQAAVDDVLKKGLIGTVADKKGNYSETDIDITYEGVYFMLRSLKELDETLSNLQYIELLKAALHFQLKDVAEKCIKRISGIVDYDPLFLDGLKALSYLKDKCLGLKGLSEFKDKYIALLLSEPLRVILHPNFTKCSVDLIILLLQQSELKVKDESQLLLVIIAWLEARKEDRRIFRMTLLKNLAFINISTADFRYATTNYPDFFDEKEQKLVLAFRNAVGSEVKFFRDNLPEWYSTKTRKHI